MPHASVDLSLVSQNFLRKYSKVSCNFNEKKGGKTVFRVIMPSNLLNMILTPFHITQLLT